MHRILNLIIPTEKIFFELLAEQSRYALDGAKFLNKAVSNSRIKDKDIDAMREIEKAGDRARHNTVKKLNQSLITPFDREDIYALSSILDDLLDATDRLMHRFKIYNKMSPSKAVKEMSKILLLTIEEVNLTIIDLPKGGIKMLEHCKKIGELEERADVYYREALRKLFMGKNAKDIIVEKELIEYAEEAIDRCQDAAILVEGIIIKSS